MKTLLDDFLHRRRAQQLAPKPEFRWYYFGQLIHGETGPVIRIRGTGNYYGEVYQDGVRVAQTKPMSCFAGDMIRLDEFAPGPWCKPLPPIVRRMRISLWRWGLIR